MLKTAERVRLRNMISIEAERFDVLSLIQESTGARKEQKGSWIQARKHSFSSLSLMEMSR